MNVLTRRRHWVLTVCLSLCMAAGEGLKKIV